MSPFVDVVIGLLTWLSGAEVEAIKSNYIIFIPAMVLRAFILLYSFFYCIKKGFWYLLPLLVLVFSSLVVELIAFVGLKIEFGQLLKGLANLGQVVFYPLVYFTISSLLGVDDLKKWIVYSSIIILSAINVGNLGLGYVYWGGAGTMGVMPYGTQNSLSTIVVVLSAYLAFHAFYYRDIRYLWLWAFAIFAAWSMGSKFALFGSLVISLYAFYLNINRTYLSIVLYFIGFPILFFVLWSLVKDSGASSRLVYHYDDGGILKAVFGGREDRFVVWYETLKYFDFYNYFFGGGYQYPNSIANDNGLYFKRVDNLEMDVLDVLLKYGMVGAIVVYGWWFYFLIKTYSESLERHVKLFIFLVVFLCMIQSTFSGHFIFSGMSPIYVIAVLVCLKKMDFSRKLQRVG
tara:strand:+ start:828 stop:2033 length:1206 start_codon:yes stop_codon:yes gene_type:complete